MEASRLPHALELSHDTAHGLVKRRRARTPTALGSERQPDYGFGGTLLDEGAKLFSVPIVCRQPGEAGFFTDPYSVQAVALACAGGSLIYMHVYACLVPIMSNLIGIAPNAPSLEEVAETSAKVATRYVASLGQVSHTAHRVELVLAGFCLAHSRYEAIEIRPHFENEAFREFECGQLDMSAGQAHFFGDHTNEASERLDDRRAKLVKEHPILWHRAPLRVLRDFIEASEFETIGGDVQAGFTSGADFTRVATVAPRIHGQPEAYARFNNIDLDEIGHVGPCMIGITGMVGL